MRKLAWVARSLALVVFGSAGANVMADDSSDACLGRGAALVAALSTGDVVKAGADFDAAMKAALPPEALAAVWMSTVAKLGAFEGADAAVAAAGNDAAPNLAVVPLRFKDGRLNAVVACDRGGKVAGFHLMPRPDPRVETQVPPRDGFTTEPMTVGLDPVKLEATLYRPRSASASLPAVLLIAGSGPQDRDSTIGATKPLRDVAEGLAQRGIIVLAYDKRTHTHPERPVKTVDDEVVDDAVDALRRLAKVPGVDATRLFVLGHSWGGTWAPRVVQRAGNAAGMVLLAPGVESLDEAYRRQLRFLAERDGRVDEQEQAALDQAAAEAARLVALRHGKASDGRLPLGIQASYWASLNGYDPVQEARSTGQPVLALWAERDYQVPAKPAMARWRAVYGDSAALTAAVVDGVGHTFLPMTDPPTPEKLLEPGHVRTDVVERIAAWVLRPRGEAAAAGSSS